MTDNDIVLAIVFSTLIILLLIAGVAITVFISGRKQAKLQLDYERELRAAQQEVQEQTMVNVARDLHDNIGQMLTVIKMQLDSKSRSNELLTTELLPIQSTLADTIQQVRLLGRSLNSDMLEEYGLIQALEQEVTRLQLAVNAQFHWQNDGEEPKLNKDQRLMSFRMFQEVMNNTLKHANAKNIYIELKGNNAFRLVVKDDGKGFDYEKMVGEGRGMGLKNIIKRAGLAGLICRVDTSEGKGSIFTLEIPNV